jgi:hypothetical protein
MFRAVFLPIIRSFSAYNGSGTVYGPRWPSATRIRTELRPDPGRPSRINCISAVVRLRSSWWWAERLPETCIIIITNKNWNSVHLLVLFTRNLSRWTVIQSVTMNGHTICHDERSYNPKISQNLFIFTVTKELLQLNMLFFVLSHIMRL